MIEKCPSSKYSSPDEILSQTIIRTTAAASSKETVRSVRFSTVSVRKYDLCLGDHPSVRQGAPVSLDWTYRRKESRYPLDEYERRRSNIAAKRRRREHHRHYDNNNNVSSKDEDRLRQRSSLERLHLLKELGYSRKEIEEAAERARKIREQRFRTIRRVERSDAVRSIIDKVLLRHCSRRRRRQQQQEQQLQQKQLQQRQQLKAIPSSETTLSSLWTEEEEEEEYCIDATKMRNNSTLRHPSPALLLAASSNENTIYLTKSSDRFPAAA